jgi:hypothetical protein
MQSEHITTKYASSNLAHGEAYSIQHCVIKFVCNLWQVGVFLRFPPPKKKRLPRYSWNIVESGVKHYINYPFLFWYWITTAQRTISLRYVICNVHCSAMLYVVSILSHIVYRSDAKGILHFILFYNEGWSNYWLIKQVSISQSNKTKACYSIYNYINKQ